MPHLEVAHGDLVVLLEVVTGESLNGLGPCCRPHEHLPVRPDLRADLAQLGLEAHVEHAVGLVEDEVGDALEVGVADLEVVDEATRRSNYDLHAAPQVVHLAGLGDATVDDGVLHI